MEPSGKRLHNYGWIFHSYVSVYQRVDQNMARPTRKFRLNLYCILLLGKMMILPQLTQCMAKTKPWPTQGFDENPYEPTRNLHDGRFYSHFNIFQWQSWYSAEILGVFYIGQQHTTAHSPRRDSVFRCRLWPRQRSGPDSPRATTPAGVAAVSGPAPVDQWRSPLW